MENGDLVLWRLLPLALLIFINAFFTCAELALISLNKNKLEKLSSSGNRQAKRILALTLHPSKFIASVQVVITMASLLSSALAADSFSRGLTSLFLSMGVQIPENTLSIISLVIITILLSFLTIVFGELLPKRIALKKADALAFAMSGIVLLVSRVFAPVVWLLTKTTNGILRLIGINPDADKEEVTEEEILLMIDAGSTKGTIKAREKEIFHNIFEFDDKSAGEVMTHRRDTAMLRLEDSDDEWEKTIVSNRHGFFPICGKSADDIIGVLNSRDYFCLKDRSRESVMAQAVEPVQFVPTTVRTDKLFEKMRNSRNHFAVVLDEHGGMMGIVTMKDLLQELVGNLDDDTSIPIEQPLIRKAGPQTWILNGAVSLDKAARELNVPLPVDRHDTFAGFVFNLLGQIPEDGSCPELEEAGLKIKILEIREHRLEKVKVTLTAS